MASIAKSSENLLKLKESFMRLQNIYNIGTIVGTKAADVQNALAASNIKAIIDIGISMAATKPYLLQGNQYYIAKSCLMVALHALLITNGSSNDLITVLKAVYLMNLPSSEADIEQEIMQRLDLRSLSNDGLKIKAALRTVKAQVGSDAPRDASQQAVDRLLHMCTQLDIPSFIATSDFADLIVAPNWSLKCFRTSWLVPRNRTPLR
eukprot:TRINITY_DN6625_c0_g2_i1.p2 TRINITY_DN6625_c0_g2~~TRINITY_DN6625_c0_g2_i1.p2  ORF type:complete len:207 (+),score=38.35 TRINITY_DN6625_c0_g2_i1:1006-1626(+)